MNQYLKFFLTIIITVFILVPNISIASTSGIPGYSLIESGAGSCHDCHSFSGSAPANLLTITGSSTALAGTTNSYIITLVAPDFQVTNFGGFDISATDGSLQPVDSETTIINSELVHSSRKVTTDTGSSNDVQWSFDWQAPSTTGTSTLSACGLPVNGDSVAVPHEKSSSRDGKAACTTFNIQVQLAPVAVAGNNQTVTEGNAVTLDGTASSDADGTISSYTWVQLSGTSTTLSNENTDTASFNAPAVAANTTDELTFQLTVTDNDGLTDTSTLSVFVQDVLVSNTPPVASAGTDQSVNETTSVTLNASTSTDDGSIASYSWLQTAGNNTVTLNNASTVMADFTAPSVTISGDLLTFELTVTDNLGVSSTDTINVTINDVDTPPVAKITNASGAAISTINNNIPVTLYGNFSSDADGPITAYSWVQTAGSAIVSPGASNASSFSFTTPDDANNTIDIQLTITGDEGSIQDFISVSLTLINQPPVVDTGSGQLLTESASVSLDGSLSSDTDGTISSYLWVQLSGTTAVLNNATLSIADFSAPDVPANTTDELIFQLTITDNYGLTDTGTVSVFVQDALVTNQLPVADAGTDQIVNENILINLDASASTDDGSIVTYLWQQITGINTIALDDSSAITPSFTTPEVTSSNDDIDIRLTVTDDLGTQSTDIVHIIINDVDTPPVARITDISGTVISNINNNLPITLYGTFSSDAQGPITAYSWNQTAGTAIVSPGASNASSFSFTTPDDATNTLDIQLIVTGDEGVVQNTITATLTLVNQPPVADAGSAQLVVEGDAVTLDGSFSSDIDGVIASYLWQQIAGTTAVLSNANTRIASFNAPGVPANTTENLTFRITVTDAYGLTDSADVIVSVEDVLVSNIQPTASAGADQSINENTLVTLDGSASSDDGSIGTYAWIQTAGASITLNNASTASPSFTSPEVSSAGDVLIFQLIVTDNLGVASVADSISVTVNDVDTPPVASITDVSGTVISSVNNNRLVTLYGNFSTDAQGPISAYSWSQTAGTAIVSPGASNASSFSFSAPDDAGNAISIQLTVTGDEGSVQNSITAVLTLINQPPVADAGSAQLVVEGDATNLNASTSSDIDGVIASYLWQQVAGTTAVLSNANTRIASFNAPGVPANTTENLTFRITVTDAYGLTDSADVSVSVQDVLVVNVQPTASAGADQSINENTLVTLDGSASSDDGSIAAYAWIQTAGASITLNNPSTVSPSFTSPEVSSAGDILSFQLIVTDNLGVPSIADSISVSVNDVDTPPVASITDISGTVISTINNNSLITLYGNFSTDAQGPITAYSWSQTAGTAIVNPGASNASSFSFTAPDDASNTISIQLTVTGDEGFVQNTLNLTLALINQPAVVDAGPEQSISEGAIINLVGSASDINNNLVSVQWRQINCSPNCILPSVNIALPLINNMATARVLSPIINATAQQLDFELSATDSNGLNTTSTTRITVSDNGITGFPSNATTFYSFNGQPMAIEVESKTAGSTLFISNLQSQSNTSISDNTNRPLSFPYELNNLEITLSAPASVQVTLYFSQATMDNYDFYQYLNSNGWTNTSKAKNFNDINFNTITGWTEISQEVEFSADRRSVKILLSDGGVSDSNPAALLISSQGGIGQNTAVPSTQPGKSGAINPLFLLLFSFTFGLFKRLNRH